MRSPAVIRPAAEVHGIRVAAAWNRLGTFMSTTNNRVQPGLPSFLAPRHFRASAIEGYFRAMTSKCAG